MNTRVLLALIGLLALVAGTLILMRTRDDSSRPSADRSAAATPAVSPPASPHAHAATADRVPAYQNAAEARQLPATLPPAEFAGKSREAYLVAKEIPQTLAQLPCYCECDKAFGHKSLHTCFVDDHASHCAVCVDEALLAYKLQKEDKLTPDQVREVIIEKYSAAHADH